MKNILTSKNEIEKISESVNPIKETIEIPNLTLESVTGVLGGITWTNEENGVGVDRARWSAHEKLAGKNFQARATWFSRFNEIGEMTGRVMVLQDPTGTDPYTRIECTDLTGDSPMKNIWEIGVPTE